jgi:hypothetical protein
MSQHHVTRQRAEVPEFHIVVRRPGRGPIAPYRLVIATAFAMIVGGGPLWTAAASGVAVDTALLRCLVAGAFAWLVLGRANAILKAATPPRSPSSGPDADTVAGGTPPA